MKYMGSKARFSKEILPIILKDRTEEQYYVEPFVGGCNIIDKVKGRRIASDNNKYLIALWKGLQQGRELIMEIPKELYDKARNQYNERENHNFDDFTIGWIGFMASYNGRFFDGGYNGNYTKRNYTKESIDNILKQVPNIIGVNFYSCDYDKLVIPNESIIYCDIPYKNTKQYSTSKNFDHDKFWQWCRDISKDNTVFVSEYNAPNDFECVWQKEVNVAIRPNKTLAQVEKLFKFSPTNIQ